MKCIEVCKEDAIIIEKAIPQIDYTRCVRCGDCAAVCPTGTICVGRRGYRILVGGKLGRHPQLGLELTALAEDELVLSHLEKVIEFYFSESKNGERLGNIISRIGFKTFRVKVGIPE